MERRGQAKTVERGGRKRQVADHSPEASRLDKLLLQDGNGTRLRAGHGSERERGLGGNGRRKRGDPQE